MVLPLPVGPVTRMMPFGRVISRSMARELLLAEADALEVEHLLGARQQAHHHPLAVGDGHRREAHVVVAAGDLEADAAVLGQALLGDVEPAHDLDARDDARLERARQRLDRLVEHVVDAEAHADLALEGLEVDVAGALLDGVLQQRVHQLDDRRVVGRRRAGPAAPG